MLRDFRMIASPRVCIHNPTVERWLAYRSVRQDPNRARNSNRLRHFQFCVVEAPRDQRLTPAKPRGSTR